METKTHQDPSEKPDPPAGKRPRGGRGGLGGRGGRGGGGRGHKHKTKHRGKDPKKSSQEAGSESAIADGNAVGVGLPGEEVTAAVAQLLGLEDGLPLRGGGGDGALATNGGDASHTSKRATFSADVEDIGTAGSESRIGNDRRRDDGKSKKRQTQKQKSKQGASDGADAMAPAGASDLNATAAEFVPSFGAMSITSSTQQQQGKEGSNANLTLQALQQSEKRKQQKGKKGKGGKIDTRQKQGKGPKNQPREAEAADDAIAIDAQRRETKGKQGKKRAPPAVEAPHKPAIPPNQPQTTNDLNYGAGSPITVVHIAEKPSIATAIAHGLSGGSTSPYGRSLPVHEFVNPPFSKAPKASKVTHVVTSVAGHVFNVDFPEEYRSWESVDPAELFLAPVVKKPCKGSVCKHLQEVAKGCDFLVLWMDCDREGENINFEVLDVCMHSMKGSGPYDRVYRAHFSAINPSDIKKAYESLGKPDRNQSLSVDARQELDLKVGVAFSRFQTRYFQGRYGDLDSAVLSYGPCQTPTLGFCVQRHIEIETFKPEPYWVLDLGVMNSGSMCRALWDSGRSFNRNKVDALVTKCQEASPPASAKVVSVVSKEKKQGRPVPLNTVALLKACSKALGIGPHHALGCAERLYLSGYLSYPRTESTKYPKSFDIDGTLRDQTQDNRWGTYVSKLLRDGVNVSKGGVDMGDHPPITPCRHARAGELSGDMARVYDLVTRHFIASVSHDAVWQSTTVRLAIEELEDKGTFTIGGKKLVDPGFLAIMMHRQYGDEGEDGRRDGDADEEEKDLPEFKEGDCYGLFFSGSKKSDKVSLTPASGKFCTLDVKERMTTPPTYLTESELISRMEKHGIGTDASISTHIENVLKRNYVELIPGRKLKPSRLGLVLANGYHLIDASLVLPQVRSDIEDQCNKIAKGLANRDDVVKKAIELFSAKFNFFVDNINKMDVLFGSSFAQLADVGKPFTRCGLTRRYLQFITGPPPRLYNKITENVYPLPIGGEIKQWTGRHCPVEGCNFELCLYSVGAPPRTFPLCPNCYNNPRPEYGPQPGEEPAAAKPEDAEDEAKERSIRRMAGKNMVRECPHPDKHPLIEEMTVSPDPESDGVLILDPHLGPKWRLVSTREPTIVHFPKCVEKVTILDKTDDVLGCHLMTIEFKEGESPIEGKKKYVSCFAIDEVMQGLLFLRGGGDEVATYTYDFEAQEEVVSKYNLEAEGDAEDEGTHHVSRALGRQEERQCDRYFLQVTCDGDTEAGETDMTSVEEVRAAKICKNECLNRGGRKCSWRWNAEGCTGGGGTTGIQCTKPRASRIREEGHREVCGALDRENMYNCADGSQLCCTDSDMQTVNFANKGWGECRKTNRSSPANPREDPRPREDSPVGSIKCTKPNPRRVQREGHEAVCNGFATRDNMYECQDGSKLCCTDSDLRRVTFKNKGWGQCRITG
ncbi:hypothetical protein ACHAXT_013339 [Thalassiosira profunda]